VKILDADLLRHDPYRPNYSRAVLSVLGPVATLALWGLAAWVCLAL